jgi:energy-coupling factor transport system permease protein
MRLGYLPRDSVIHGLNPLTKFAFLCVAGLLSFILPRPQELVVLLAAVTAAACVATVARPWIRFMRMALLPALVITAINILLSPYQGDRMAFANYQGSNEVLLHHEWGILGITVTTFGLQKAVFLGLRWLNLVAPAGLFAFTTKTEDFAATLTTLRVPYTISFAIGTALRLVPALIEDAQTVLAAQRARGLDWDRRIIGRVRALPPLAFPVIACAIRRAMETAAAMEARAYGATGSRTLCYPVTFSRADVYGLAGVGVMLVLGVMSRIGKP